MVCEVEGLQRLAADIATDTSVSDNAAIDERLHAKVRAELEVLQARLRDPLDAAFEKCYAEQLTPKDEAEATIAEAANIKAGEPRAEVELNRAGSC